MTVIAWDGESLAADKQFTTGSGVKSTGTKIYKIGKLLVGGSGTAICVAEMMEWIQNGRKRSKFPENIDEHTTIIVVENMNVFRYEKSHCPRHIEDPFYAIGSGTEYALAAMHLGKSAKEAVEIASKFDDGCGNGVDVLYPPGRKPKENRCSTKSRKR